VKASFHPEAAAEHLAHTARYEAAQRGLGARYIAAVEAAAAYVSEAPHRFPVECEPGIRRYHLRSFPYTLFFREAEGGVYFYAIAPYRRDPDYWKQRLA
jgi:toxin ParE1/3/4